MSEQSSESASNFVFSLNIPPWKLFGWFRRLQLWATGDWQLHHDTTCPLMHQALYSFLGKHQITQVTQPPYTRYVALQLLAFSKTKITFEKEISGHQWDSGKYDGAANGDWEKCVRSQGAYFEEHWGVIFLCTMFLVCSSINVSIFHITWLDTFWANHICICIYIFTEYMK